MAKLPKRSILLLVPVLFAALGARQPVDKFTATLSGANEVPAVEPAGSGTATVTIDDHTVTWRVEVTGVDHPTMAHIHGAALGENGGVILPLFKEDKGADFSGVLTEGSATVEDSVIEAIRAGKAYVNVHTTANPGGEMRGQLEPAM